MVDIKVAAIEVLSRVYAYGEIDQFIITSRSQYQQLIW